MPRKFGNLRHSRLGSPRYGFRPDLCFGVRVEVFNHLLGECGVTFCAERKLIHPAVLAIPSEDRAALSD